VDFTGCPVNISHKQDLMAQQQMHSRAAHQSRL
jgi:hypothetical protein